MKKNKLARIAIVTMLILMVPLIAMQFSDEVVWDIADFIVAGCLLFGAGFTYELLSSKVGAGAYKAAVGIGVFSVLVLMWMNLAVGIIGNENNPVNLLYLAIPLIGIFGASITRMNSRGMAKTLLTMALVQVLIPVIGIAIWQPKVSFWGSAGMVGVLILNAVFAMLFAVASLLFQRSYQD